MIEMATELVQTAPKELSVPSGYFQLPAWVLVATVGIILSLIGIIYHKLDKDIAENTKDIKTNGAADSKCVEDVRVMDTRLNLIDAAGVKKEDLDRIWEDRFNKEATQVHINTDRINRLEDARNIQTREELSKGGYVTMDKLIESNAKLMESFKKVLSEKAESIEDNLTLKLENMRLSIIANGKDKKLAKKGAK
jgi:hypothetical protein